MNYEYDGVKACIFCNGVDCKTYRNNEVAKTLYVCTTHGKYAVWDGFELGSELFTKNKHIISGYLYHTRNREHEFYFHTMNNI